MAAANLVPTLLARAESKHVQIVIPLSQPSAQRAADCMLPTQYRSQFMLRTAKPWQEFLSAAHSWQVAEDFNNKSWEILADIVETRRAQNFGNLDWSKLIMPGEFRYCGCGMYLLPHGLTVCGRCMHREWNHTEQAKVAAASSTRHHNRLVAIRTALVIHRLCFGYGATFWKHTPELLNKPEPDPIPAILDLLRT